MLTFCKAFATPRHLAAFALALWLTGVGCFIGCEVSASAAVGAGPVAGVEADSCNAFGGHDCCHKTGVNKGAPSSRQTPAETDCCPLAGLSADAARKVRLSPAAPAGIAGEMTTPAHAQKSTPRSAFRLRVPDRGSTHLRHCVFLI